MITEDATLLLLSLCLLSGVLSDNQVFILRTIIRERVRRRRLQR